PAAGRGPNLVTPVPARRCQAPHRRSGSCRSGTRGREGNGGEAGQLARRWWGAGSIVNDRGSTWRLVTARRVPYLDPMRLGWTVAVAVWAWAGVLHAEPLPY